MRTPKLAHIPPDKVKRNPDNPRIIFRQDELEILLNSIKKVGIQVPLSIYQDGKKDKYVILDGERRWLCAQKLNLESIPAVIEPKPSRLENILRMFNIHNVRIQWDLLAVALKLKEIERLLMHEKGPHSIKDIAAMTGVTLSTTKRAFDLLTLPQKYISLLKKELEKPKSEQKFSEDFFIEMMKAIKSIERHTPEIIEKTPKSKIMDKFVNKYRKGTITNIVRFRDISKIARAEKTGISRQKSIQMIDEIINVPGRRIEDAFKGPIAEAYEERSLQQDIERLTERLEIMDPKLSKKSDVQGKLKRLFEIIKKLIT